MNRFILRVSFSSITNTLRTKAKENPMQNVVRFEGQNLTWTLKELDVIQLLYQRHSDAFAYGLIQLGLQKGNVIGISLNKQQTSEIVVSQLGALKAGVIVKTIKSNLKDNLKDCNSFVFSPTLEIDQQSIKDNLQNLIPEMLNCYQGDLLKSKNYPKLQSLIHTGFYSINGTLKYKQFLVYATKNYNVLKLPELDENFDQQYLEKNQKEDYHKDYFLGYYQKIQGIVQSLKQGSMYTCN